MKYKKTKTPIPLIAASAVSGLLVCLAFTIQALSLICFVALVPLITAILIYRDSDCGMKKCAFVFAATLYLFNMLWLYSMYDLTQYGISKGISILLLTLAIIVIAAAEGTVFLVAFLPFNALRKTNIPMIAIFPLLYVFAEFLQGCLWEFAFPWARLGTVLAPHPEMIQTASLFGTLFVSLIVVVINELIATGTALFIKNKSFRKASVCIFAAFTIFGANMLYGSAKITVGEAKRESADTVKVACVQANLSSLDILDLTLEDTIRKYSELTSSASAQQPDIYIWGETAVATDYSKSLAQSLKSNIDSLNNATLITGIFDRDGDKLYNAMVTIRSDDVAQPLYYKRELVPMGEYIPFGNALKSLVPPGFGDNTPGTEAVIQDTGFGKAGGIICYESVYPYVAREDTKAGADFFVMISNDSWFGDTPALRQHLSHAVMRCVENGRDMARSGNTGISAVISAQGKIIEETEPNTETVLTADIALSDEITPYTYLGDIIAIPGALMFLWGFVIIIKRKTDKTEKSML